MSRPLAVLRPEPGNAATAARIWERGHEAIRLPLFELRPLDWTPPDAEAFDALFLTSANAPPMAGPALQKFAHLPVYTVGAATRAAALTAGLDVVHSGERGGADLLAAAIDRGVQRALLLSGREHVLQTGGPVLETIAVYASDAVPVAPSDLAQLAGSVALVHSARAGRRLAELIDDAGISRSAFRLAAISETALDAAASGWRDCAIADFPDDAALIASAITLAD